MVIYVSSIQMAQHSSDKPYFFQKNRAPISCYSKLKADKNNLLHHRYLIVTKSCDRPSHVTGLLAGVTVLDLPALPVSRFSLGGLGVI